MTDTRDIIDFCEAIKKVACGGDCGLPAWFCRNFCPLDVTRCVEYGKPQTAQKKIDELEAADMDEVCAVCGWHLKAHTNTPWKWCPGGKATVFTPKPKKPPKDEPPRGSDVDESCYTNFDEPAKPRMEPYIKDMEAFKAWMDKIPSNLMAWSGAVPGDEQACRPYPDGIGWRPVEGGAK